jgi:DNA-binding winged helix-turn-helix (wHTH) protein
VFIFAGYIFDPKSGLAFGEHSIALPPKERELLHFLLQAEGKVVSKDEVVRGVWHGGVASDESISRAIYRIRLAMQAAGGPPVVTTVYNGGYRISAAIQKKLEISNTANASQTSNRTSVVKPMVMCAHAFAARQSPEDLLIALQATRAATALDPQYPWAWVTLAELYIAQAHRSFTQPKEAGQYAHDAIQKALDLNPRCAPALALRGWIHAILEGQLSTGLEELNQALEIDSQCWQAFFLKTSVMQALSQHDIAISMARRAQGLNTFSIACCTALPLQLLLAGQTKDAYTSALDLVQRFASLDSVQELMSIIFSTLGDYAQALLFAKRAAQISPHTPAMHAQLAYVLARSNHQAQAVEILQSIRASDLPTPFAAIAPVYLAMGSKHAALDMLWEAKKKALPQFYCMRDDPRLSELHEEREFQHLWN